MLSPKLPQLRQWEIGLNRNGFAAVGLKTNGLRGSEYLN